MSRFYRVSFNYVDSSGKQINHSLFNTKDIALSFILQIGHASNVQDVTCDLVELETISVIDLCNALHGPDDKYEVVNADRKE